MGPGRSTHESINLVKLNEFIYDAILEIRNLLRQGLVHIPHDVMAHVVELDTEVTQVLKDAGLLNIINANVGHVDLFLLMFHVLETVRAYLYCILGLDVLQNLKTFYTFTKRNPDENSNAATLDELLKFYWYVDNLQGWLSAIISVINLRQGKSDDAISPLKIQSLVSFCKLVQQFVPGVVHREGSQDIYELLDLPKLRELSKMEDTDNVTDKKLAESLSTVASDFITLFLMISGSLILRLADLVENIAKEVDNFSATKGVLNVERTDKNHEGIRSIEVIVTGVFMCFDLLLGAHLSVLEAIAQREEPMLHSMPIVGGSHRDYLEQPPTSMPPTQMVLSRMFAIAQRVALRKDNEHDAVYQYKIVVQTAEEKPSPLNILREVIQHLAMTAYNAPAKPEQEGECEFLLPSTTHGDSPSTATTATSSINGSEEPTKVFSAAFALARMLDTLPIVVFMLSIGADDPMPDDAKKHWTEMHEKFMDMLFVPCEPDDKGAIAVAYFSGRPAAPTAAQLRRRSEQYRSVCMHVEQNPNYRFDKDRLFNDITAFAARVLTVFTPSMVTTIARATPLLAEVLDAKPAKVIGYIKIGNRKIWSRRFNIHTVENFSSVEEVTAATKTFKLSYSKCPEPIHRWNLKLGRDLMADTLDEVKMAARDICDSREVSLEEVRDQIIPAMKVRRNPGECKADAEMVLGPFSRVFIRPTLTADKMAVKCTEVIDCLERGEDVLVFGFGVSGAGKTSTLVQLDTGGGNKQPGLVQQWITMLLDFNLTELRIFSLEIYMEDPPKAQGDKETPDAAIQKKPIAIEIPGLLPFRWGNDEYKLDDIRRLHKLREPFINNVMSKILEYIDVQRVILPTSNNPNSSRSHVLLSIYLGRNKETGKPHMMHIADLAGSENKFNTQDDIVKSRFRELLTKRGDKKLDSLFDREYVDIDKDGNKVVRAPNPLKTFDVDPGDNLENRPNLFKAFHDADQTYDKTFYVFDNAKVIHAYVSFDLEADKKFRMPKIAKNTNVLVMRHVGILREAFQELHLQKDTTTLGKMKPEMKEPLKVLVKTVTESLKKKGLGFSGLEPAEQDPTAFAETVIAHILNINGLDVIVDTMVTNSSLTAPPLNDLYGYCWYACLLSERFRTSEMNQFPVTNQENYAGRANNYVALVNFFSRLYPLMFYAKAEAKYDIAKGKGFHVFEKKSKRMNETSEFWRIVGYDPKSHVDAWWKQNWPEKWPKDKPFLGMPLFLEDPKKVKESNKKEYAPSRLVFEVAFTVMSIIVDYNNVMSDMVISYMRNCTYEGVIINRELDEMREDLKNAVTVQIKAENPLAKPYVDVACIGSVSHPLLGDAFDALATVSDDSVKRASQAQSLIFKVAYALSFPVNNEESATHESFDYVSLVRKLSARDETVTFQAGKYIFPVAMCVMNLDASIKDPPTPFIDSTRLRDKLRLYESLAYGPAKYLDAHILQTLGLQGHAATVDLLRNEVLKGVLQTLTEMSMFPFETQSISGTATNIAKSLYTKLGKDFSKTASEFITLVERFSSSSIVGNILFVDVMCKFGTPAACYLQPLMCGQKHDKWRYILEGMVPLDANIESSSPDLNFNFDQQIALLASTTSSESILNDNETQTKCLVNFQPLPGSPPPA